MHSRPFFSPSSNKNGHKHDNDKTRYVCNIDPITSLSMYQTRTPHHHCTGTRTVAARWAPKAPLQSRRAEKSASDMVNASRQRSCNNIVRRFRAITFLFSDERRHRVLSVWRNSLPTDFLKNNWWTVFMASIDHRRFTDGSLYDYWPTAKDRSTLATMSKQQCRSNRQLCCLLLRHCCWCGPA